MQKVDACSVNSGARGCNKCLDQNILLKTGIRNTNLMQQLYNDKDTPRGGEHIVTGAEKAADQVGAGGGNSIRSRSHNPTAFYPTPGQGRRLITVCCIHGM